MIRNFLQKIEKKTKKNSHPDKNTLLDSEEIEIEVCTGWNFHARPGQTHAKTSEIQSDLCKNQWIQTQPKSISTNKFQFFLTYN